MESINYDVIASASREIQRIELRAHELKQKNASIYDDPEIREMTGFEYDKGSNKAFFNAPITSYTVGFARRMLKDMKNHDEITIDVNSPGGSANAGITLFNVFSSAPQKINMRVLGMAYSAASVMAQGADFRAVAPGASIGIHRSWTIGWGNEGEFTDLSNRLSRCDKSILDIYSAVVPVGKMRSVKNYMIEDTSLSGKESVDLGLADAVLTKEELKEAARKDKAAEDKKATKAKPKIKPKAAAAPAAEVKAEEEEEQPKPEEEKADCGPRHPDGEEVDEDEETAEEAEAGVEGDDDEDTGEEQVDDEDEGYEDVPEEELAKQTAEIVAKKKVLTALAQAGINGEGLDADVVNKLATALNQAGDGFAEKEDVIAAKASGEQPAEAEEEEDEKPKEENKDELEQAARTLAELGIWLNPNA